MLEEFLEKAASYLRSQKRPEHLLVKEYGSYSERVCEYTYSDFDKGYQKKSRGNNEKQVRSIGAFISAIKEELRRRNNKTGDKATVRLSLDGGFFTADDDFNGGVNIEYKRLNSQQWELFKSGINKTMDHRSFLLFLQALKPSIDKFDDVFRSYVTLRLVGHSELTSNPIITDNGQSSGYTCTYKLEDGTDGEETFPEGFRLNLQFAKAGVMTYDISVDLLFFRDDDDELKIQVLCPEFEHIEEQAIIDEAEKVKNDISESEDLLILSDF